MSGTELEVETVPVSEVAVEDIVAVLEAAFGQDFGAGWFRWKHRDNPFGESLGWVARRHGRVIGVRLLMRWQLDTGDRVIEALRPVDTATHPEAHGTGVFRRLTEHALAAASAEGRAQLVFNTPNARSRPGYQGLGWTILAAVRHAVGPVLPLAGVALSEGDDLLEVLERERRPAGCLATARSAAYARWRYSPRSGLRYGAASLAQADEPNVIVYRIVRRFGVRVLAVQELLGREDERRALVRAVAHRERARGVLAAVGEGALPTVSGPGLPRGSSRVAVYPLQSISPDPLLRRSWALSLGDLERVM